VKGLLKRIEFWWEERQIHKAYAGQKEEYEDQDYWNELWHLDQKRRRYSDRQLITKARRHYVPIPPESGKEGFWEEEDEENWFLTDKGVSHLRKAIRAEKKASRDIWLSWVPLVSALAVLLGALSGLIAYLSK